ncbi:GDSL esterase/lipase At4g10955-like [Andrographis paniculata]|uniref:GDSL esterase/lipase At4g10955-like n=1 Tax=Andrographis paniculata TaxID=175694 RepID=UPI0021E86532|nr:GDSL esterase/lipase At4g10955-like [Andrographis paniculata]XP_051121576.1 GDSL esterase/lipase At4g10955-like [Andrographis paniculata]
MELDKDNFYQSGPSFLTALDWSNSNHRRSIAASLVQGVYAMERDRRQNRHGGPYAMAPPWWQFFNFNLVEILFDKHDVSIFGAVFEYTAYSHAVVCYSGSQSPPPRYVVAVRGTILNAGIREEDSKLNLHCVLNNLDRSTRFATALAAAARWSAAAGIWLAGHSLGSAIALLVGRKMIKQYGIHLETYLFNPPFPSPPIGRLSNETLKFGFRLAGNLATAALATALKVENKEKDHFRVLSRWIPYLFVNPWDPICSEYLGYFEQREKMGMIGRIAMKHSIGSIVGKTMMGKEDDCEAAHLIPCGYLSINSGSGYRSFMEAHGIRQWWSPDLELRYQLHRYNSFK